MYLFLQRMFTVISLLVMSFFLGMFAGTYERCYLQITLGFLCCGVALGIGSI